VEPEFWHGRWERGETGWHHDDFNPHLQAHWSRLGAQPGCRVLVPLCGKSRDLLWLAGEGHSVTGVEISPVAVRAFFEENGLSAKVSRNGAFQRWRADEIEILLGDFFHLTPGDLEAVGAVYDRASLIALPPPMRRHYAEHLAALFTPGVRDLLITLEYPQHEMQGPPFSVSEDEVRLLFEPAFAVDPLDTLNVLAETPRYRDRGLSRLTERVYALRRLPLAGGGGR
jgi:thiopurine S-methyltransferase